MDEKRETLRADLIAAKALIDTPEKWRKRSGDEGPNTPCCIVVAAHRVRAIDTPAFFAMREALLNALPNGAGVGWARSSALGWFNDIERTTHPDVMALFDRAIAAVSEPSQS